MGPRQRRPVVPVHVYDLRRRHDHPISDSGSAEWPGLARLARLWDSDPPQRLRPISTGSKICGEAVKEGPHRLRTLGFDVGDTCTVDARGPLVGGHVDPRPPHHVVADEFVDEGMEPACPVLLGTAIQHALKGSNGVQTIGLPDGPRRVLGTHQRCSSFLCTNEAGSFAQGRLCCPTRHRYYDPLRLLLGCRPLPGVTGYGQTLLDSQGRGRGEPLQFPRHPSYRSTSPTPKGPSSSAPRSQTTSVAFAKSTQARHPLAPPKRETFTTLQTWLYAADRPFAPPASTPASRPNPEVSLAGILASLGTRLTPAG
jgi:hypothetical protein